MKLRPMYRSDIEHVLEIERKSFGQPYSWEIFIQELKIKVAHVWVVNYHRKILGYIDFWLVLKEMELVSIAVHPDYRSQGVGRVMIEGMLRFARQHKVRLVFLDVRESNIAAQKFYSKFGFKKMGVRRRYYSDNLENAIIMKKEMLAE